MRTSSGRCSPRPWRSLPRSLTRPRVALNGLTWRAIGLVAAACAVWTLSMTVHDMPGAFGDLDGVVFISLEVGGTFYTAAVTALVMDLPLLAVGNLGPQRGWRRAA